MCTPLSISCDDADAAVNVDADAADMIVTSVSMTHRRTSVIGLLILIAVLADNGSSSSGTVVFV